MVFAQNMRRARAARAPAHQVNLRWDPAHTFALDAAQDADAGVEIDDTRPLRRPAGDLVSAGAALADAGPRARPPPARRTAGPHGARTCCCSPGMLWLVVFFVVPMVFLLSTRRCRPARRRDGLRADLPLRQPTPTPSRATATQFIRSFVYAGIATVLALAIGYPLAYAIAFKAGRGRTSCWCWSSRRSSPAS